MTTINDLNEDDYLYVDDTDEVLKVVTVNAQTREDGLAEGSITLEEENGAKTTVDAETVDMDLHTGEISIVNPALAENADQVLLKFAEEEISKYASVSGRGHDFNGISHIETVRDLLAAVHFATESSPPQQ